MFRSCHFQIAVRKSKVWSQTCSKKIDAKISKSKRNTFLMHGEMVQGEYEP